ncbi:MAG: DUF3494 domain-containing protein [Verrucomicrobia bacterium]|nr:DUF3494 domain-containing protein [Verrucomicrobiota bacterium]
MNQEGQAPAAKTNGAPNRARFIAEVTLTVLLVQNAVSGAHAPVNLGTAGNYVVLAKSGISTVPPAAVTGNMGVSPIDSTAITGFSLIMDSTGQFSTSAQVTGQVYAPDYASPTPAHLTTAIGDMETAYTDAAGRSLPDFTELGSGDIGGRTLAPGLYKWGTGVTIPTDVTLAGGPNDVWIFQIAGNLTIAGSKSVILSGGSQAGNIFWQVSGGVGVDLSTTSHFEGIILSQAGINLQNGASINGRLLAQTAVTLGANSITAPSTTLLPPRFGPASRASNGEVTLVITNTPGFTLTLQYSINLTNWTTFATPTPTVSPLVTTNFTTSADAWRFYRAFYP